MDTTGDKATCIRSLGLMATGAPGDFAEIYTADAHNREAKAEPTEARGTGPDAFFATARWLRASFTDLRWDVQDTVQEGDLVVLHTRHSGRQTGPFTVYDDDAVVEMVFPPTGRSFAVTQTHWFRMRDGRIAEHWANRDDREMGEQLGWTPPNPVYLGKMLLARYRARQDARD